MGDGLLRSRMGSVEAAVLDEPSPTPVPPLPNPAALPVVEAPPYGLCEYEWDCGYVSWLIGCESSWVTTNVSWAGARGLMQIMPVHADKFAAHGWDYWADVFVPERNIAIGYEVYLEWGGWGPWDC